MKVGVLLLLVLFVVASSVSAIKINEMEMNPEGTDAGNEWIELYNEEEINLENYKLVNNDGDEIILNGSFSGYYIYTFNKQWLDNSDEKVFLYQNNNLIDETELLEDNKNNNKTHQLCGSEWRFLEATKGEENNCETEEQNQEQENPTDDETNSEEEQDEEITEVMEEQNPSQTSGTGISKKKEPIILEAIKLNPKDIKSESSKDLNRENKSNLAVYGFMVFCILLVVLFMLRKRKAYSSKFD